MSVRSGIIGLCLLILLSGPGLLLAPTAGREISCRPRPSPGRHLPLPFGEESWAERLDTALCCCEGMADCCLARSRAPLAALALASPQPRSTESGPARWGDALFQPQAGPAAGPLEQPLPRRERPVYLRISSLLI